MTVWHGRIEYTAVNYCYAVFPCDVSKTIFSAPRPVLPRPRPPTSGFEGPWDQDQDPWTTTPGPEVVSRCLETMNYNTGRRSGVKTPQDQDQDLRTKTLVVSATQINPAVDLSSYNTVRQRGIQTNCDVYGWNYDLPSHTDMTLRWCEDQDFRCQEQDQWSQDKDQDRRCQDQDQCFQGQDQDHRC